MGDSLDLSRVLRLSGKCGEPMPRTLNDGYGMALACSLEGEHGGCHEAVGVRWEAGAHDASREQVGQ